MHEIVKRNLMKKILVLMVKTYSAHHVFSELKGMGRTKESIKFRLPLSLQGSGGKLVIHFAKHFPRAKQSQTFFFFYSGLPLFKFVLVFVGAKNRLFVWEIFLMFSY